MAFMRFLPPAPQYMRGAFGRGTAIDRVRETPLWRLQPPLGVIRKIYDSGMRGGLRHDLCEHFGAAAQNKRRLLEKG